MLWHLVELAVPATTEEDYTPDASSHDYRLWQSSHSSHHNMGRMLSAFTGCRHNRRTSGPSILPCGAGKSHTPIHIEMAYMGV